MPRNAESKETIKKNTINAMQKLGVYKPEYNQVIDIYSELCEQYILFTKEFKSSGYQYETSTAQGGSKKSAIISTLETLRKDILQYSDRLCLNPKSNNVIPNNEKKKSKLTEALKGL
jgi:phage terminase small subunit